MEHGGRYSASAILDPYRLGTASAPAFDAQLSGSLMSNGLDPLLAEAGRQPDVLASRFGPSDRGLSQFGGGFGFLSGCVISGGELSGTACLRTRIRSSRGWRQ